MFSPCNLEGTTETPSPVLPDSIVILEDLSLVSLGASQYEVSFTVVWDPPLERYGAGDYEIYVGGTPITEEDEKDFVRTTEVRLSVYGSQNFIITFITYSKVRRMQL